MPRNLRGYTRHRALEPGPWFKSVSPTEYLTRYADILARLDPHDVADRLTRVRTVSVLVCWERAEDCHAGRAWCHRHLVAQWLEDRLGIIVPELGHPALDRFAFLKHQNTAAPDYRVSALARAAS